jgi:hypothetical protein
MTSQHLRRPAVRIVVALGLLLVATACKVPLSTGAASTSAVAPATGDAAAASAQLNGLQVHVEDTGAHYNRDDWGDWASAGAGCTTREAVLRDQGQGETQDKSCKSSCPESVAPCWTSPYDGMTTRDPAALQIDHVVPVRQANISGARGWSKEQRVAFYNDRDNLVAASVHSNESKGDSDPAKWRPVQAFQCAYAARYINVKAKYRLTVDTDEKTALVAMLQAC